MEEKYLYPMPGARWIISRQVAGRSMTLFQNSLLFDPDDAETVLHALGLPLSKKSLDRYFPERVGKGRCPTLELLELTNVLDPTNPKRNKKEGGV